MEQRRCHRLSIELLVSFESMGAVHIAKTNDISATGLCILTRENLKIGKILPIRLTLPQGQKISLQVKIIWINEIPLGSISEYKVGLQIISSNRSEEEKFVQFYAQQLAEFYKDR